MRQRSPAYRQRIRDWSDEKTVFRAEKPCNPARARALGFKAKKGYVVVRVRLRKGNRSRPAPRMGRKPGKNVKRVSPGLSLQKMAELKAAKRFTNLRVLNSYLAANDGVHAYYEVLFGPKN